MKCHLIQLLSRSEPLVALSQSFIALHLLMQSRMAIA
jgi:hypothetical protein